MTEAPTRRLRREGRTIAVMIAMYCRAHDGDAPRDDEGVCVECARLLAYARLRLRYCRYGAEKPICADCPTHCYAPEMRERVRVVMRYAGPRMLARHPALAFWHVIDGRRSAPERR